MQWFICMLYKTVIFIVSGKIATEKLDMQEFLDILIDLSWFSIQAGIKTVSHILPIQDLLPGEFVFFLFFSCFAVFQHI